MSYYKQKIPVLQTGLAKWAMQQFIMQIKCQRGLTNAIQKSGVNGKWIILEKPYDIPFSKLIKILHVKAHWQTDEEFLRDWQALGKHFLAIVRQLHYLMANK